VVTEDVSAYTKADFLQPGKKTEMLARFSSVAPEQGGADTQRDPRGFALKFYTEAGNYDMVGNNTPVFFVKNPMPSIVVRLTGIPRNACTSTPRSAR